MQTGYLKKLKDKGIEIHARSVFLQGLLLMDIEQIKLGKVHLGITFNATPHFIASAKVDMPPIPGFYIKDELTEKVYTGYLKGHDILSTLKCGVS